MANQGITGSFPSILFRGTLLVAVGSFVFLQTSGVAQEEAVPGRPGGFPFPHGPSFLDQFFNPGGEGEHEQLAKVEVTVREEQEFGEQVLRSFQDDLKGRRINVTGRGRQVEYLQKLVGSLRPHMTNGERYRSIRVLFADTGIADAYSIPGGTIIVFRGMLESADSEAALIGVLGHELAHLDRGHQLLPLKRLKLTRQNLKAAKQDPRAIFRQASVFSAAFMKPFRPEDELDADRDGATWAYRAGYDPRAMLVLFAKLHERDQIGKFTPAFLRTHPYHSDRRDAIEDLNSELQRTDPKDNLYVGRTNIRRLLPMSERRFDD